MIPPSSIPELDTGHLELRDRRIGLVLVALVITFNTLVLGFSTIGLSLGFVVAYLLWQRGCWRPDRKRLLLPYILCLGFFVLHFAEEFLTKFYLAFPGYFGMSWSERSFLIFNFVWIAAFASSAVGVRKERPAAYLIVIFFALIGGIVNGACHIALSLVRERYFPGTITSPLMIAGGLILLRRLQIPGVLLAAQGVMFSVLVPGTVVWWFPRNLIHSDWMIRHITGWIPLALGAIVYFYCAAQFLLHGGTPNISFARPLAFLIGREPVGLVHQSIYRCSRNPMYVGVIAMVFGEALLFGSRNLLFYAFALCVWFHLVVILIEEPHLRRTRGEEYREYCRKTPRWIPRLWRPWLRLRSSHLSVNPDPDRDAKS